MAEYIGCRNCNSPNCKGCNIKTLETMLSNGKFDCLMNENRCINPSADVAPVRHGCWERVIPSKSAAKWSTRVSCSNCHSAGYVHHKYCPNCGAKMDGGADNG